MHRIGRIAALLAFAAALALFGTLALSTGWKGLGLWGSTSTELKAFYVLSAACGVVMWFSALTLPLFGRRKRLPAWSGSAASGLFGIGLIAGILTYVIPCSGPS